MSSVVISGDTSGAITIAAPAIAGTYTQTLPMITGTLGTLNSGTAITSTSGTSIPFTGIPSGVRRITVMLAGVSTNGTGVIQIQIGSGSYTISGYLSMGGYIQNGGASGVTSFTTGFPITGAESATSVYHGSMVLTLIGSNQWVANGSFARSDSLVQNFGQGSITLSGTLDQLRLIGSATGSPSDTFDAGTINILYE
jgi:hypothetical protein